MRSSSAAQHPTLACLLTTTLMNASHGIAMTDASHRVQWANAAFLRWSGRSMESTVGTLLTESLLPPYRAATASPELDHVMNDTSSSHVVDVATSFSGGKPATLRVAVQPLHDEKGHPCGHALTATDVTDLAVEPTRTCGSSDAKGDFIANVSHEIRTPMTGVIGMLELTLSTPLSAEQKRYLELARSSAESLMHLINDILDVSKIDASMLHLHPAPFDLHAFLDDTTQSFLPIAQAKGIGLRLLREPGVPRVVVADKLRLGQILNNLVGNAMKFTAHGEVRIEVSAALGPSQHALLQIRVVDTGAGIAASAMKRIFDPFVQVDGSCTRSRSGTGLGLTISRRLAELMGGDIQVASTRGEGSTFTVRVPVNTRRPRGNGCLHGANAAVGDSNVPSRVPGCGRRPSNILLVDDDPVSSLVTKTLLTMAGHHVDTAAAGDEALRLFGARSYDLVITDLHLPGICGLELAAHIRSLPDDKAVPVVGLTASAMKEDRQAALEAGMAAFLTKPVAKRVLCDAVDCHLKEHQRVQ